MPACISLLWNERESRYVEHRRTLVGTGCKERSRLRLPSGSTACYRKAQGGSIGAVRFGSASRSIERCPELNERRGQLTRWGPHLCDHSRRAEYASACVDLSQQETRGHHRRTASGPDSQREVVRGCHGEGKADAP